MALGRVGEKSQRSDAAAGHLVYRVDQSREAWRATQEYREGIEKARVSRSRNGLCTDYDQAGARSHGDGSERGCEAARRIVRDSRGSGALDQRHDVYDLEEDVRAYLMQYKMSLGEEFYRPLETDLEDVRLEGRFPDQHVSRPQNRRTPMLIVR